MDSNGYGGDGIYLDNQTGLVRVENNLVYRVSASAVEMVQGPSATQRGEHHPEQHPGISRARDGAVSSPYQNGVPTAVPQVYAVIEQSVLFRPDHASGPSFRCRVDAFTAAASIYGVSAMQQQYLLADGQRFRSRSKRLPYNPVPATGNDAPCAANSNKFTFYTFAQWQTQEGEDTQSLVQNPGFNNPAYPADDYSLPKGSPGVGFVVFDPTQAGRSNPVINPPAVPATFLTMTYNPATGY